MSTDILSEMVESGALGHKQETERLFLLWQQRVAEAQETLDNAKRQLAAARTERKQARVQYEQEQRSRRKPRQTNIVRRILDDLNDGPKQRQDIIASTGLDATTVSSTLTRLRKASFVARLGDNFAGLWTLTEAGRDFAKSDKPFPKLS